MNLFERKSKLLDFYQTLIEDQHGLFTADYHDRFRAGAKNFGQEQFSIVIAGRFSVGKSLLINRAFLQSDILPYKNEPTTCHPVYIVYGDKKQLILRDAEGHSEVIAEDEEAIKTALIKYVAQYGDDHDRYQTFELRWPDAEMLKNGVVLVDTIGTDDTEERYIQQTYAEMERAIVVVFLFNMGQAGTYSEQALIEKYLSNSGKKLFIVLTRADVRDPDEQNLILRDFRQRLQPFFSAQGIRAEDRIFVTSAKNGQGLTELRQRLVEFVANDRFKELFQQHTQQIQLSFQAVGGQIDIRLQDLQAKKEGDERSLRETLKKIDQIEEELNHDELKFDDLKQELVDEAQANLEDEIAKLKNRTAQALRTADVTEIKTYAEEMVETLIKLVEQIGKRVQRRIREELRNRVRQWVTSLDSEKFYTRFDSIGAFSSLDVANTASYAGGLSGVGLAGYGAWQTFVAYTTATTTVANTGFLAWLGSYFVGGVGVAPGIAALSVGIPFIAGGAALALAGYAIAQKVAKRRDRNQRDDTIRIVKDMLTKTEKEISKAIENYVEARIDEQLAHLHKETTQEQQRLRGIIDQKDRVALQHQIDAEQAKHQALVSYHNQLQALLPL
jgi:predicted GTPase